MPRKAYALILTALFSTHANALTYPATCRGPTATVTHIEGFDTQKSWLVATYMEPDAVAYCNYAIRSDATTKLPDAKSVAKCAREFLAKKDGELVSAQANCKAGTLRMSELQEPIKMPVQTDCSSRGPQIVTLFRMLCPTYTGPTERQEKTFSEKNEHEPD